MKTRRKTMLQRTNDPQKAQEWCERERAKGRSIGFIPTMGALHEGHLSLVEQSVRENDATCVSIFVNPLQFDQEGDFTFYPRDWDGDCKLLEAAGCELVFTGELAAFFPGRLDAQGEFPDSELIDPGPGAAGLEGEFRQGHFPGVATIVHRLFELTRPTRAYFGQKDFQQTLVVQSVAELLGYPEVVVCATSREAEGLARSSRNRRLSEAEKVDALALVRSLRAARDAWAKGERDARALEAIMQNVLTGAPIEVEYAAVRDPKQWTAEVPLGELQHAVALVAAHVGPVRLIDNLVLSDPAELG